MIRPAFRTWHETLQHGSFVNENRLYLQFIDVRTFVVLRIRNRRFQHFADDLCGLLLMKAEHLHRAVNT
jgi:hypothetical protein